MSVKPLQLVTTGKQLRKTPLTLECAELDLEGVAWGTLASCRRAGRCESLRQTLQRVRIANFKLDGSAGLQKCSQAVHLLAGHIGKSRSPPTQQGIQPKQTFPRPKKGVDKQQQAISPSKAPPTKPRPRSLTGLTTSDRQALPDVFRDNYFLIRDNAHLLVLPVHLKNCDGNPAYEAMKSHGVHLHCPSIVHTAHCPKHAISHVIVLSDTHA